MKLLKDKVVVGELDGCIGYLNDGTFLGEVTEEWLKSEGYTLEKDAISEMYASIPTIYIMNEKDEKVGEYLSGRITFYSGEYFGELKPKDLESMGYYLLASND